MSLVNLKQAISQDGVQLTILILIVVLHTYNEIGPCHVSTGAEAHMHINLML